MSKRATCLALAVMMLSAFAYYHARSQILTNREAVAEADQVWFVPSPRIAKVLSLGYEVMIAELTLIHAQYYIVDHLDRLHSGELSSSEKEKIRDNFTNLLWSAAAFDPHLDFIYEFGAFALNTRFGIWGASNAAELLEYGSRINPDNPRFPEIIGFLYLLNNASKDMAAFWFREALDRPGVNPQIVWLLDRTVKPSVCQAELQHQTFLRTSELAADKEEKKEYLKKAQQYGSIAILQKTWIKYRQDLGESARFEDLLNLLDSQNQLPHDPYGGQWFLNRSGCVNTTSIIDFTSGPNAVEAQIEKEYGIQIHTTEENEPVKEENSGNPDGEMKTEN